MTNEPNEDQQVFLARLLDGSRRLDDPETAAFFAKYPVMRQHYDELRVVVEGISTLAAENEAAGRQSIQEATEEDRNQVERYWSAVVSPSTSDDVAPQRSGASPWTWLSAAAAILLVFAGARALLWDPPPNEADPGLRNRLASDFDVSPRGLVEGFDAFRIEPAPAPGTRVVFRVFELTGDEAWIEAEVLGAEWTPSEVDRAKMEEQGALRWEFEFTDPLQSRLEVGGAEAFLPGFEDAAGGSADSR